MHNLQEIKFAQVDSQQPEMLWVEFCQENFKSNNTIYKVCMFGFSPLHSRIVITGQCKVHF